MTIKVVKLLEKKIMKIQEQCKQMRYGSTSN